MKQTPNELFESLSREFSNKKEIINEELGQIVDLKPLVQMESSPKQGFEIAFEKFLAEGGTLDPILNNDTKVNTEVKEEKVKADPKLKFEMTSKLGGAYKVSDGVKNIESHNYDNTVENINNVNAQEMLTGLQCEINYNKELTLDEAKELVVKNLSKDPLHYVKEGQFGIKGLGYTESTQNQNDGESYGGSGYSDKLKDGGDSMVPVKESLTYLRMMGEDSTSFDEAKDKAISASQEKAGIKEDEEVEVKAAPAKPKRVKKESVDSKLSEIGRQGDIVKLEAQINYLDEIIEEKSNRLSSIDEDENLSELVDKNKMKEMQREVKLLDKKKAQMEKMYEKMCGKKYMKTEIVDEGDDYQGFEDEDEMENHYLDLDSVDEVKKSSK